MDGSCGLAGTVAVTWVVWAEEVDFLTCCFLSSQTAPPLSLWEDVSRLVDISDTGMRGLKTPGPCWISSVFTFTGISHRTKAQEAAMCVSVCVAAAVPPEKQKTRSGAIFSWS